MNSLTWNFIEVNVLILLMYSAYVLVKNNLTLGLRRVFLNSIPFLAILLIGLKSLFDLSEFSVGLSMVELDPVIVDGSGVEVINNAMSFGLISVYQLGLLLITPVFLFRLFRVIGFFIRNESELDGEFRIYHVNGKASFSFFNRIQIAPELIENNQQIVIEHEKIHAIKWHSLDVLVAELMHIVFWVNPVFFWMKRELINLHEFQVDQVMYRKHKVNYLKFLVNYALGFNGTHYLLTSQFYNQLSLKKRIKNMKTRTKNRMWMMVIIPIIGFATLFVQCTKNEQNVEEADLEQASEALNENEPIYDEVDVSPEFKGEEGAMGTYIGNNIKYPEAAKADSIQGTVYVGFVVNSTGSIIKAKIMRGVNELLDAEALRVISGMPDWTPAEKDGKNVSVSYTIPIQFKLK